MASFADLKQLDRWDLTAAVGLFLAVVAPGVLVIYLFDAYILQELPSATLLMLAGSLTLPILAINALALACIGPFVGAIVAGQTSGRQILFWLLVWSTSTLYTAIGAKYFLTLDLTAFIATVALTNVAYAVAVMAAMRFLAKP